MFSPKNSALTTQWPPSTAFNTPRNFHYDASTPRSKSISHVHQNQTESQHKIAKALRKHREGMEKKLQLYCLCHTFQSMGKCLAHDCILSAYDKQQHTLICAACFTQQVVEARKFMLPIEKAVSLLDNDILKMKAEVQAEIIAIGHIEDLLFKSFSAEAAEIDVCLKKIDQRFQDLAKKLSKLIHQDVLRELGQLKKTIKKYTYEPSNTHQGQKMLKSLKSNRIYTLQLNRQKYLKKDPSGSPSIPSRPHIKQLVFEHLVLSQMCGHLQLRKSKCEWTNMSNNLIRQCTESKLKKVSASVNSLKL